MAQLRQDYDEFRKAATGIVVIGPEGPQRFSQYWRQNQLPFIGLPDPTHSVLKLYGQQIKLFKWGRMPAMLIIDKAGQVRFAHYGSNMSDIPENQDILEVLQDLNDPAIPKSLE